MVNTVVRVLITALIVAVLFLTGPGTPLAGGDSGRGKSLGEARKSLENQIINTPGFSGIAHLEEAGEIVVFVEDEQAKGIVSDTFEGFPVRKEVTGKILALSVAIAEPEAPGQMDQLNTNRQEEVRPLVGGTSVSAYVESESWAGTLGMITYNNKILSNAHVIALDLSNEFLPAGTPVIQPGRLDGGSSANQAGTLQAYIPLTFTNNINKPNPTIHYADAAIAVIDYGVEGLSGWQFSETGNYQISGTTTVTEGDTVRKSGRTTGVTQNTVAYNNASIWVQYDTNKYAYYQDQIAINQTFSDSGDSGSAVDKDGSFVGLVFAGGDTYSFACKASYIIDGLGIAVEPQGYTFTAPSPIDLGGMVPGGTYTGSATGSLTGGDINGYTVSGVDTKSVDKGYMVSNGNVLSNKLQIGPAAGNLGPADLPQTFLDESSAGTYSVPLYVSQYIDYTDVVASGYTITITFTVTEK